MHKQRGEEGRLMVIGGYWAGEGCRMSPSLLRSSWNVIIERCVEEQKSGSGVPRDLWSENQGPNGS